MTQHSVEKELFHSQKFPSPTTFPKDSCACSTWYNRCAVKSAAQLRICGERTFLIRTPFVDNFLTNLSFLPCVQLEIAIHNYFDFFGRQIFVKFCRGVSLWWSVVMLRTANELAEARQHVGSANQLAKTCQYIGGRRLVMFSKKNIWIRKPTCDHQDVPFKTRNRF